MKSFVLFIGLFLGSFSSVFADNTTTPTASLERGKQKATTCFACHGPTGNTTVSNWPKLAAQHKSYIAKELIDYRAGKTSGRYDSTMTPNALSLTDEDIQDLSIYFASLKGDFGAVEQQYLEQGQALYRNGDVSKGIPACTACHGPAGLGIETAIFPRLAGQNVEYTTLQLKAFRDKTRTNDLNQMMQLTAQNLTDNDIAALASYINGLHPRPLAARP